MSYKKEIHNKLKDNIDGIGDLYAVTLGKDYAVIEGHKGIISFDSTQIVVKLKKGSVTFRGENLIIASSQSNELVIKGHAQEIKFEGIAKQ